APALFAPGARPGAFPTGRSSGLVAVAQRLRMDGVCAAAADRDGEAGGDVDRGGGERAGQAGGVEVGLQAGDADVIAAAQDQRVVVRERGGVDGGCAAAADRVGYV